MSILKNLSVCRAQNMCSVPGSGKSGGKWPSTQGILCLENPWTEPGGLYSWNAKSENTTEQLKHVQNIY